MVSQPLDFVSKFWRDLNSLGVGTSMDFRARQSPGEGLRVEAPPDDPYKRSYSEILSIQQAGSQGFRVIDIDPNNLDREDFNCTVSSADITRLFGGQISSAALSALGYTPFESPVNPYWRTVELQLNGTFLKVEFLPVRNNEQLANGGVDNSFGEVSGLISSSPAYFNEVDKNSILVQFESNSENPIIAKHGDVFQVPFNTVYITMKTGYQVGLPKIRLTVGFNARMVSLDDRALIQRPAFGKGIGLLNDNPFHMVPFSISYADVTQVGNVAMAITTAGAPTWTRELVINDASAGVPDGGLCGWITGITWNARCDAPGQADLAFELVSGDSPYVNTIRRLYYATGSVEGTAGLLYSKTIDHVAALQEPIRFTLKKGMSLALNLRMNTGGPNTRHSFGIVGYCTSHLSGSPLPASYAKNIPFYPTWGMTENPYPLD